MLRNLNLKFIILGFLLFSFYSCASPIQWEGKASKHVSTYMKTFKKFRKNICVPRAEQIFDKYLLEYRGKGIWIPKINDDVDVEAIKSLLPVMEKKLTWIRTQKKLVLNNGVPRTSVILPLRKKLEKLLELKKTELKNDETVIKKARKNSLKLLVALKKDYTDLLRKVSFLSNFQFPVDHLKNRKVYDSYKDKQDIESKKIANYTFLYRKILEDGAYNKDQTESDIYLRTTLDTLFFELQNHGFYITEDARYDMEFILSKIESELLRGKHKILERLTEWEERTRRTLDFYTALNLPKNQEPMIPGDNNSTPNKQLIKKHNVATHRLKDFIYKKQAEVYQYWLNQPELVRAIFVIETILLNEVGGVDGEDALERMDVARVIMNRLDKPHYYSLTKSDFIYPYLKKALSSQNLQNHKWLNLLFKQGEFSFTYYYMNGTLGIFCPDISPLAKKLRRKNVEIALKVLREKKSDFKTTRYFSRASMIGRIHMDSVWDDYEAYPERPGPLAKGQSKLKKAFQEGDYSYLYSFKDPNHDTYQVIQIDDTNYALGSKSGTQLFYKYRNPHFFKYFTKINNPTLETNQ